MTVHLADVRNRASSQFKLQQAIRVMRAWDDDCTQAIGEDLRVGAAKLK